MEVEEEEKEGRKEGAVKKQNLHQRGEEKRRLKYRSEYISSTHFSL